MQAAATFDERIALHLDQMSPAEQRVARVFRENREEVLYASAASLAAKASTSDATVVRTTKALGFAGMEELRRTLAAELKQSLSIASRMRETLREVGDDLHATFDLTLDIHVESIQSLRRDIAPELFRKAVSLIANARRVVVFGIGPSSMMATYFAAQLGRFGIDATSLTRTGLLFADELRTLRAGDALVAMAYGHVYRELAVLLDETDRHGIRKLLLTDNLGPKLRGRVDLVLPVARGRANMLSMHTATLGLLEALLVGIAAKRPEETIQSLEDLNKLRERIVGAPVNLATRQSNRQTD
ncbi:transcriptional regulator [Hyphomicrobium denitrificans 1NES1]|uniref:Transcriptional regulator n=1 Tax=Hyphomicrobium denitrificans 1NES1 TaxID=670307 RepID=N0BH60_9HYPH|nr:MurR/RpiR family transcriptional regulator [Hyphomicrobium denitrificans]AGK59781.1 transcriptional regulator [Hyphomicrobium denitrificans 1NES1]